MRHDNAVNHSIGRNRNGVDNRVNRITQKFETGDERYIQFAGREFAGERRGMIEIYRSAPVVNERTRVEIFNAAESQRVHAQTSSGSTEAVCVRAGLLPEGRWL